MPGKQLLLFQSFAKAICLFFGTSCKVGLARCAILKKQLVSNASNTQISLGGCRIADGAGTVGIG
jgi:hypothetical protein